MTPIEKWKAEAREFTSRPYRPNQDADPLLKEALSLFEAMEGEPVIYVLEQHFPSKNLWRCFDHSSKYTDLPEGGLPSLPDEGVRMRWAEYIRRIPNQKGG